jgi:hypothetical protein
MKVNIEEFSPCNKGLDYYKSQPDFKAAWENCPRGDWMLWIAQRLQVDTKVLILAKGKCAETIIHLMKDEKSVNAVKAAIAYGMSEITERDLDIAYAYAYEVEIREFSLTAAAAALSANLSGSADSLATVVTDARTCFFDYDAEVKKEGLLKLANICREILTEQVLEKISNLEQ